MKTLIRFTYQGNITIDRKLGKVFDLTVSKDETRYFINDVYLDIKNNRLSSTDGKVLFVYNFNEYEKSLLKDFGEGYFRVVRGKKETLLVPVHIEGKFPDMDKILNEEKRIFEDESLYDFTNRPENNSKTMYKIFKSLKMPVNYVLTEKILKNLDTFKIYQTVKETARFIYLEGDNWILLVNGISID